MTILVFFFYYFSITSINLHQSKKNQNMKDNQEKNNSAI